MEVRVLSSAPDKPAIQASKQDTTWSTILLLCAFDFCKYLAFTVGLE